MKKRMRLNKKEKEAITQEISKRMIDIVTATSKSHAANMVKENLGNLHYSDTQDSISVNYNIDMCVGDFIQIVSRMRREEDNREMNKEVGK